MILSFTAITKQLELKSFAFRAEKLEAGLDFISFVSSKGDLMLTVQLEDEYGRLDIPLEAFDEQEFSKPMHRLEKQWQKLLNPIVKPVLSKHTKELINLTRQRLRSHESLIAHLDLTMSRLVLLRERAGKKPQNRVSDTSIFNHYVSLIHTCQQRIDRARDKQKMVLTRLSQLQP